VQGSSVLFHKALVAAAIVIPAAAFLAAALENRRDVLREGEGTVRRTAAVLDEHARRVFDTVDLLLGRVEERIRNLSNPEINTDETNRFLRTLKAPLPQAVSIWVSDSTGRVLAGSQDWNANTGISDRDFFAVHRNGKPETTISRAFTGRATSISSFAVSRSRTTQTGAFNGVVHVALSPDYFANVFREASPSGSHLAILMRGDGSVLASDPAAAGGRIALDHPFMQAVAASPGGGDYHGVSPTEDATGVYVYRRIAPYDAYVMFGQTNEALARRWYTNLRLYGAVAGAASFFLLVLSLLALKRVQAEHEALRELSNQSEQRLAAEQRLFQSQKLESIGQLTGGIAHDFNNLLAIILGNLGMLAKFVRGNERAELLLERATQGAERGATLTQRLLAFARRQDLAPQSVDVSVLVRGVMDLMRSTIGSQVVIATEIEPNVPPALVDPNQLELAVLNLAVNARDAMPTGGAITLSVGCRSLAPENDLSLPAGEYICLALVDSGLGMDAATLARASEPFFTTKEVGKGTGLGLSMVHGLAIQSGGAFRLQSWKGEGTRAEIWLPRSQQTAPVVHEASVEPGAASGAGVILLVDDDELVRQSTAGMLEDEGYRVVQAPDAMTGLGLLRAQAFDLLITDLVMPGMSGAVLAARVAAEKPDLPVLVITGYAERAGEVPQHLPRLGKPFSAVELYSAVSRLLATADAPV
jgi:signal transduction histidine kinase